MKCPFCNSISSKVIDKRDSGEFVRRRRECISCSRRFTSYERVEEIPLIVIKKDGKRSSFDRNKLRKGITESCEKRPVTHEQIEKLISRIENELRRGDSEEITSKYIGELVMNNLKKIDKVAYIRFASVYRDFKDINDFRKEIKKINS
ncbi:MAG: transcriptional regulator NrdR [Nanobdellota archaeon]